MCDYIQQQFLNNQYNINKKKISHPLPPKKTKNYKKQLPKNFQLPPRFPLAMPKKQHTWFSAGEIQGTFNWWPLPSIFPMTAVALISTELNRHGTSQLKPRTRTDVFFVTSLGGG